MMMYDELAKQLRDNAEFLVKASSGCLSNSFAETMSQAADAIEEMQKCLDGVCADNDSLCKQLDELSKARDAACWGCKCKKMEPQKEK